MELREIYGGKRRNGDAARKTEDRRQKTE